MMPYPPKEADREERITYEVIVDCYDDYEVTMGWYCYLQDKLAFPYEAIWKVGKRAQPETVEVLGMAHTDDCTTDIQVVIRVREGEVADDLVVPLATVDSVDGHPTRDEAIGDWVYWLGQGNRLIAPDEYEAY